MNRLIFILVLLLPVMTFAQHSQLAATPPMGWNSWNCMGFEINEDQVKEVADYMAANLHRFGYEYVVIDAGWYYPDAVKTYMGSSKENPEQAIDAYGRLIPDTIKYPSAKNGNGLKPLADYIHSKGLKFGIHIMRGIPWNAYEQNTPIFGTTLRAKDVADTINVCDWNHSMYGLNCTTANGKAYYESIVALYKEWGVDFIKIDDISREIKKDEIVAFNEAVRSCGRDIVISLSPGPSPLAEAELLSEKANMWRICNDVWDSWAIIHANFDYCAQWYNYSKPGSWPDADMLPIGKLRITGGDEWVAGLIGGKFGEIANEFSRLTHDEQYTVMNLWCMFRSPLMIGSYLPYNDKFSNSLLTNKELIELDQHSTGNKEIFRSDDLSVWSAEHTSKDMKYLALFNIGDDVQKVELKDFLEKGTDTSNVKDIWTKKKLKANFIELKPHASAVFYLK